MSAGVAVVITPEPNDAGSPHGRRFSSDLGHELTQRLRVGPLLLIRQLGDVLIHDTSVGRSNRRLCHEPSVPSGSDAGQRHASAISPREVFDLDRWHSIGRFYAEDLAEKIDLSLRRYPNSLSATEAMALALKHDQRHR